VLSRLFRNKFVAYLKQAFHRGDLGFHGKLEPLGERNNFIRWVNEIARSEWVVYAKPPFGGPQQVLKYLARYTHRVAIANRRLLALHEGQVTFRWKDYSQVSKARTMTLAVNEFIRRFPLHVLPGGFVKIRHFGFLANRGRRDNIALCRQLLAAKAIPRLPPFTRGLSDEATGTSALPTLQSRTHEPARDAAPAGVSQRPTLRDIGRGDHKEHVMKERSDHNESCPRATRELHGELRSRAFQPSHKNLPTTAQTRCQRQIPTLVLRRPRQVPPRTRKKASLSPGAVSVRRFNPHSPTA
jgi:hypothetical protein